MMAKTTGVRNIEEANKIVQRILEIIRDFEPQYWIIENPQSGTLKKQYFMAELLVNGADYCKCGMPYRNKEQGSGTM